MNSGAGGIFNAGDDGSKGTAPGVLEDFHRDEFRVRGHSLRAHAVDGSGNHPGDMRGMTKLAVRGKTKLGSVGTNEVLNAVFKFAAISIWLSTIPASRMATRARVTPLPR